RLSYLRHAISYISTDNGATSMISCGHRPCVFLTPSHRVRNEKALSPAHVGVSHARERPIPDPGYRRVCDGDDRQGRDGNGIWRRADLLSADGIRGLSPLLDLAGPSGNLHRGPE